ncbi:hypothetical protein WICANDRAFT_82070 [Wickerhamomyces anomalus NRRL Y-366-8]|uniref:Uncharacterized protein n=1 Tax=Wickerhamomyces anomalus (strain ATCC 58044 / CBS 1984 / NCYC 433 / NRRL Y-366-8) TaxID=683960 RepID=A0A1E3P9L6_WICAA|nr:uncharacterized protein WICANDRAFT_82070 [Wickerhamomyces anomalus NRRL Y-366-8]ODQ61904.1 hypothetical protein WICANDRAFT_82070 [Wickerhamomyces anomalus NRRL Y-366-8]
MFVLAIWTQCQIFAYTQAAYISEPTEFSVNHDSSDEKSKEAPCACVYRTLFLPRIIELGFLS